MKAGAVVASLLVFSFAAVALPQPAKAENVKVYAAAVVKEPLTAIAADYEKATGNNVTLIFDTRPARRNRDFAPTPTQHC
jgi:ABC-type molybdate transport system substrate-binding protein